MRRVRKLATHFGQAEKDIEEIQTSTRKITSRGGQITQIDVSEDDEAPAGVARPTLTDTSRIKRLGG